MSRSCPGWSEGGGRRISSAKESSEDEEGEVRLRGEATKKDYMFKKQD